MEARRGEEEEDSPPAKRSRHNDDTDDADDADDETDAEQDRGVASARHDTNDGEGDEGDGEGGGLQLEVEDTSGTYPSKDPASSLLVDRISAKSFQERLSCLYDSIVSFSMNRCT